MNVWLALILGQHQHHPRARDWLDSQDETASALLCRATQQALLRLLTTASVLGAYGLEPLTNEQAWEVYHTLIADSRIGFASNEPEGLELVWETLASRSSASPKLWMDAYLAAFALTGGHQLITLDRAYRQFTGLDLPLLTGDRSGRS